MGVLEVPSALSHCLGDVLLPIYHILLEMGSFDFELEFLNNHSYLPDKQLVQEVDNTEA
jgi:hypothetical protein